LRKTVFFSNISDQNQLLKATLLNNLDEAGLVHYCKDNNPLAQKMLYSRYVEDMMILCIRYVPDKEDAREVLMDGFLKCFNHIGSYNYLGEGSLKAWLKKIMINQCLMHLRKRQPIFVSHNDLMLNEQQENHETAVDYLNAKEIMTMIHALPIGCRTVFNLYVFEGLSHGEIGQLLEISESTSKSQLHRARALLKGTILQTSKSLI
jgi:RNA polymerase sigma-70 factor (ECF subfamily)